MVTEYSNFSAKDGYASGVKNKKVLVFGLGLLGGGVATTNWLIKHGARVTVTDLKNEEQLAESVKKIRGKITFKLNGHDKKDIDDNEVIVLNPDVPIKSPFVRYALGLGKQVENEATIFYKLCPRPIIAVTGTRGKTTTVSWVNHFLGSKHKSIVSGNSYVEPLLKTLDRVKKYDWVVNEIPSFHLELWNQEVKPPRIAVVTNIYQDHLNRHGNLRRYASIKANIFKNQDKDDFLILNHDNIWTNFFLSLKPAASVYFFSLKSMPKTKNGIYHEGGILYFQENGAVSKIFNVKDFVSKWGEHGLENLLASALAAYLAGVNWNRINAKINSLPPIPFRQQIIYEDKRLKIINDTAATSPDGGIAAIKRFGAPDTVLLAGGTDRKLDFAAWSNLVKRRIKPQNIFLLAGSATDKMLKYLPKSARVFESFRECVRVALEQTGKYGKSVLLFSPAAKSFEKFKNEFDRGRQFNSIIKKEIKKWDTR